MFTKLRSSASTLPSVVGAPMRRGNQSRFDCNSSGREKRRGGGRERGRNDIGPSIADQRDAEGGREGEGDGGFRLDLCADNKRHDRRGYMTAICREHQTFSSGSEFHPQRALPDPFTQSYTQWPLDETGHLPRLKTAMSCPSRWDRRPLHRGSQTDTAALHAPGPKLAVWKNQDEIESLQRRGK